MNYQDIMKVYSWIIAETLNKHCVIDIGHARIHQPDELAHFDYVDIAAKSSRPKHLYRILIEDNVEELDSIGRQVYCIYIKVLYYDCVDADMPVWNYEGDVVFKKVYYKVDKDYYVEGLHNAEDAYRLRNK